ncbi:hypothetical protein BpHYR1_027596 [Brachionus plicatilis]|uniref:Uncharacterized protein n=1 Tax=Brachionus plicatilis TaxID=10195 RepID=A0A3M7PI84_BRAPC|nr:hypothetical protein BpHYR1_027596 [Brachionus plicatilis]
MTSVYKKEKKLLFYKYQARPENNGDEFNSIDSIDIRLREIIISYNNLFKYDNYVLRCVSIVDGALRLEGASAGLSADGT